MVAAAGLAGGFRPHHGETHRPKDTSDISVRLGPGAASVAMAGRDFLFDLLAAHPGPLHGVSRRHQAGAPYRRLEIPVPGPAGHGGCHDTDLGTHPSLDRTAGHRLWPLVGRQARGAKAPAFRRLIRSAAPS